MHTQPYSPYNIQCQFCSCKHDQFSCKWQLVASNCKMMGCIWQDLTLGPRMFGKNHDNVHCAFEDKHEDRCMENFNHKKNLGGTCKSKCLSHCLWK